MSYSEEVLETIAQRHPGEPEYVQYVREVLRAVKPLIDKKEEIYRENGILERLTEPDRIISFSVPWIDRNGKVQVNRGWRVQTSNALGPYKGGLRFHSTVNESMMKTLALEMTFKHALTGLPVGGAKGGSDFETKGKTDREMMAFCRSFVTEIAKYIGPDEDCISGDIGCAGRQINYLFGAYKKITGKFSSGIGSRDLLFGGSEVRTEAVGYGLAYMAEEICRAVGRTMNGMRVIITGAGKVALNAAAKCTAMGAKVVAMNDLDGFVSEPDGVDPILMKKIKDDAHGTIRDYAAQRPGAVYTPGKGIWNIPCDIYLPSATQHELDLEGAEALVKNGLFLVVEGAIHPTEETAAAYLKEKGVLLMPGIAASSGGIAVSALELAQDAQHRMWSFAETDEKLKAVMADAFRRIRAAAEEYSCSYEDAVMIAAFDRVAEAMIYQGIA